MAKRSLALDLRAYRCCLRLVFECMADILFTDLDWILRVQRSADHSGTWRDHRCRQPSPGYVQDLSLSW